MGVDFRQHDELFREDTRRLAQTQLEAIRLDKEMGDPSFADAIRGKTVWRLASEKTGLVLGPYRGPPRSAGG